MLSEKKCIPCEAGTPPLGGEEAKSCLAELKGDWRLDDHTGIWREFKFADFKEAMAFVNQVADLAEQEGHHPDISIKYSRVKIELSTHAIHGLSENDFILASKIDLLHKS